MSDERHVGESAGAYVLGALNQEEAHDVESHAASCAQCRAEIAELRDVVAVLPLAATSVEPSTDLRARILAASKGEDQAEAVLRRAVSNRIPATSQPGFWQRPFPVWAGVAGWVGVAAACIVLGIFIGVTGEHSRMLADLAQRPASQPLALSAPAAERVYTVKTEDLSSAVEFINQAQVWDFSVSKTGKRMPYKVIQPAHMAHAMIVTDMPAPAKPGMVYQVWLVREGRVHRGGVVMPGHGVQTIIPMRVHSGDVIAFTEEPTGGSAVPSGPFLMEQTL
jgi:anti-sigma-K factor RskA